MNDKPVLTLNADVKTFTMPQVGGAALPSQPDVLRDLKGTVEPTVAAIKAAVQAGQKDAVLLTVQAFSAAAATRKCMECGAEFTPKRKDQSCCSPTCSNRRNVKQYRLRKVSLDRSLTDGV